MADTLLGKSHYPALRVNGQILTTLLFCVTASLFLARPATDNDINTARVSGAGAVVAIGIMTMAAISIRRDAIAILLYIVAGFLAAVVAAFLAHVSHQNAQAEDAENP